LHGLGRAIETAIWAIPARTPRGLMVKLEIATCWALEELPPDDPMPAGYFTRPAGDGESFDRRAILAVWQDAVAMFGRPPVSDPRWRRGSQS
ncbi:MAG: hypothetical protein ACREFM_09615, partial [Hypericibacter sp.]